MAQNEELKEYMYDLESYFHENSKGLETVGKVIDVGLNDDGRGNTSLLIDRAIPFNKKGDAYAEHVDIIPESRDLLQSMPFNIVIYCDISVGLQSITPEALKSTRDDITGYFNEIGKPKMFKSIEITDEKTNTVSVIVESSRRITINKSEEPSTLFGVIDSISRELYNACDKLDQVLA